MRSARIAATFAIAALAVPGFASARQENPGSRTGEEVYNATCAACHREGVADAPKVGDRKRWAPLIKEGLDHLIADAIKGGKAMPPKGGDPTLTREEIARAIVHMANQSGAKWKAPR